MGMLFGFVAENDPDLPEGDPMRMIKGRIAFQGSNVVNQNWAAAMFQGLGNALATMEASRIADCYGCFPRHAREQSDAEQACIQAASKGHAVVGVLAARPMARVLVHHEETGE